MWTSDEESTPRHYSSINLNLILDQEEKDDSSSWQFHPEGRYRLIPTV